MKTFFALLRLQLISRYADLRPGNWKNLPPEKKKRTVIMTLIYVALILYLGGMLFYLENRLISALLKIGMPPVGMADLLVVAAVSLSMVATLILSFFFILSSLYLSRDSVYLASMPIRARMLLSARLTQVWISETLINAVLILPACILFGIRTGQSAGFYLRMVLVWLSSAMIPIAIGSVVATLLAKASALIKHREIIMTVGGLVLMAGYMFLSMNIGAMSSDSGTGADMLTEMVISHEALIRSVTRLFPPAAWGVNGILGDWGQLTIFMAAGLASLALVILVLGIWYRKLSLLQAETPIATGRKGIRAQDLSSTGSPFKALALREIRQILRVPAYATNILPICIMPVLLTVMMIFFIGRKTGDNGESLPQLLQTFDPAITMAILTAILCFTSDMNQALSTSVTREGRGHPYLTALPVSVRTHIFSKMAVGYVLSAAGTLLASVVLMITMPSLALPILLSLILNLVFVYGCSCLALARDIRKPRLDWVTEQEAVKQSFGVLISMITGWAILGILGLLTYLLLTNFSLTMWPLFGILLAVLAIFAFLAHRHMMHNGEKYYCDNG